VHERPRRARGHRHRDRHPLVRHAARTAGKGKLELEDPARVSDALAALAAQEPIVELLERMPLLLAVNRGYADVDTLLHDGDELASIRP